MTPPDPRPRPGDATLSIDELAATANRLRKHVLYMTNRAGSSHVGSCYSIAEILSVLYGRILNVDPARPEWEDRDRLVVSKGHAAAAVYAALAEAGFMPLEELEGFYTDGHRLAGHVTHKNVPGVEVSTGSLGHGLGIATGMALAAKLDERPHRVFALLSDGECDEGSTWEAALFAPHHKLDNLVCIIDYNKIQSLGHVKEVMDLDPLGGKMETFGWAVREIDGHDIGALLDTLQEAPFEQGRPSCIVAHTVKGKGVSFMEDQLLWHYRCPRGEEFEAALAELEAQA